MALSGYNTPVTRSQTPIVEQLVQKRSYVIKASGILSDMDGTLIDSTNAIIKHWERCVLPSCILRPRTIPSYMLTSVL